MWNKFCNLFFEDLIIPCYCKSAATCDFFVPISIDCCFNLPLARNIAELINNLIIEFKRPVPFDLLFRNCFGQRSRLVTVQIAEHKKKEVYGLKNKHAGKK